MAWLGYEHHVVLGTIDTHNIRVFIYGLSNYGILWDVKGLEHRKYCTKRSQTGDDRITKDCCGLKLEIHTLHLILVLCAVWIT